MFVRLHFMQNKLNIGNESAPTRWHIAGSLVWPFPVIKYKYVFQIKYTAVILSNRTRKLLWFEVTKVLIAVLKINLMCHLL